MTMGSNGRKAIQKDSLIRVCIFFTTESYQWPATTMVTTMIAQCVVSRQDESVPAHPLWDFREKVCLFRISKTESNRFNKLSSACDPPGNIVLPLVWSSVRSSQVTIIAHVFHKGRTARQSDTHYTHLKVNGSLLGNTIICWYFYELLNQMLNSVLKVLVSKVPKIKSASYTYSTDKYTIVSDELWLFTLTIGLDNKLYCVSSADSAQPW